MCVAVWLIAPAGGVVATAQAILTRVDHAFVVTLHYSFQTSSKLYLVMDFGAEGPWASVPRPLKCSSLAPPALPPAPPRPAQ